MPLLTSALPYASATALLLVLSLLGWRLLLAWSASPRRAHLLGTYAFLVLCAVVLCLASFRLGSGWLYSLFGTVLALAAILSVRQPSGAHPFNRWALPVAVLFLVVPFLATVFATYVRESSQGSQSRAALTGLEQAMMATASSNQEQASEIAGLPFVSALDTSAAGLASLRREALNRSLSFIILTDAQGRILLQTNLSTTVGQTVSDSLPWTSRTLNGQAVSGLSWDAQGQLAAMASAPVEPDGAQVGMVILGTAIDTAYLSRQDKAGSLLVLNGNQVIAYSATTSLDSRLALNDGLAYQAVQPAHDRFLVSLGSSRALATTDTQITLDPAAGFRLVRLTDE